MRSLAHMDSLTLAAEAVQKANETLAGHAGRRHRTCEGCLDVGVLLLVAEEAIEEVIVARPPTLTVALPDRVPRA